MKTKMKNKNQKPIEIDAHFKYRCPKSNCGYDHWISFNQAKTKNFRIVCDCGFVFKPRRIAKLKIIYATDTNNKKSKDITTDKIEVIGTPTIPVDLHSKCSKLLCGYGFTAEEASIMLNKAFQQKPTTEPSSLIKYVLQNLGELNVNN